MSRTTVFGLDTSGSVGSVALLLPDGRHEESAFGEGLIRGVAMAPEAKRILTNAGLAAADLSLVAVGLGPGSYTGVRVGVAFAKSLAFAADRPVVGVPTFEVIARGLAGDRPVVCVRDARRSALYYQEFTADGEAGPLRLVRLEDLPDVLPADALVTGDAVGGFGDLLSGDGREFAPEDLWECPALGVAELGAEIFRRMENTFAAAPSAIAASSTVSSIMFAPASRISGPP